VVKYDRQIASRIIAKSLNIPKTVVLWIIKEDLRKRKLCASFVPHSLTPEQREDQVTLSETLPQWPIQTNISLTKVLWETRPDVFAYDPETKRQSYEWVGETSCWPKKLKFQRPCIKTILIIFFNSRGVVHKEFVPEGKTVNA